MNSFRRVLAPVILLAVVATACGSGEPANGLAAATQTAEETESGTDTGFVGLPIEDAIARAEEEERTWRIGREDDTVHNLTRDYVVGRVTFEVDHGVVTEAHIEADPDDLPAPIDTKP
jgi:hypothetical protein